MSVLKTVDLKELASRKQLAEQQFRTNLNAFDAYASTDPVTGRAIGAFVRGAIEPVLCAGPLDLIPNYVAKTALGFKLNEQLGTLHSGGNNYTIYLDRPEADIKADLIEVFKKVTAGYQAEIDTYNNDIVLKEIESQIQRELRQEEKLLTDAAQARRDRITDEVKSALGGK